MDPMTPTTTAFFHACPDPVCHCFDEMNAAWRTTTTDRISGAAPDRHDDIYLLVQGWPGVVFALYFLGAAFVAGLVIGRFVL